MSTPFKPGEPGPQTTQDQVREKSAELADEAKAAARSAARDAADAAARKAETAKVAAADELSGVASALRTAAEEMRNGSPQERTFGQIAEGLADASDALRNKDLGEMVEQVSAFARRNPLVFLGGAALIGFAATRFAKASDSGISTSPAPMAGGPAVRPVPAEPRAPGAPMGGEFQ